MQASASELSTADEPCDSLARLSQSGAAPGTTASLTDRPCD